MDGVDCREVPRSSETMKTALFAVRSQGFSIYQMTSHWWLGDRTLFAMAAHNLKVFNFDGSHKSRRSQCQLPFHGVSAHAKCLKAITR